VSKPVVEQKKPKKAKKSVSEPKKESVKSISKDKVKKPSKSVDDNK